MRRAPAFAVCLALSATLTAAPSTHASTRADVEKKLAAFPKIETYDRGRLPFADADQLNAVMAELKAMLVQLNELIAAYSALPQKPADIHKQVVASKAYYDTVAKAFERRRAEVIKKAEEDAAKAQVRAAAALCKTFQRKVMGDGVHAFDGPLASRMPSMNVLLGRGEAPKLDLSDKHHYDKTMRAYRRVAEDWAAIEAACASPAYAEVGKTVCMPSGKEPRPVENPGTVCQRIGAREKALPELLGAVAKVMAKGTKPPVDAAKDINRERQYFEHQFAWSAETEAGMRANLKGFAVALGIPGAEAKVGGEWLEIAKANFDTAHAAMQAFAKTNKPKRGEAIPSYGPKLGKVVAKTLYPKAKVLSAGMSPGGWGSKKKRSKIAETETHEIFEVKNGRAQLGDVVIKLPGETLCRMIKFSVVEYDGKKAKAGSFYEQSFTTHCR